MVQVPRRVMVALALLATFAPQNLLLADEADEQRKVLIERAKEVFDGKDADRLKQLTQIIEEMAPHLQTVAAHPEPGIAAIMKLRLNEFGSGFDAIKVRSTAPGTRRLTYVVARQVGYVVSIYTSKRGWSGGEAADIKNPYVNAPWSEAWKVVLMNATLIDHNEEKVMVFSFEGRQPVDLYIGFALLPTELGPYKYEAIEASLGLEPGDPADRLARAILRGDLESIKTEITRGADLARCRDIRHSDSSLHMAAAGGHTNVVEYLIERGADPGQKNMHGSTPLARACERNDHRMARLLIEAGASAAGALEAMRQAAMGGNAELVKCLIDGGADVHAPLRRIGWSALDYACDGGHDDVVKVLIEAGADPKTASPRALLKAAQTRNLALVKLLVENGADVNVTYRYLGTPLREAISSGGRSSWPGEPTIVAYLLDQGADPYKSGEKGGTAFQEAERWSFSKKNTKEIFDLLWDYAQKDPRGPPSDKWREIPPYRKKKKVVLEPRWTEVWNAFTMLLSIDRKSRKEQAEAFATHVRRFHELYDDAPRTQAVEAMYHQFAIALFRGGEYDLAQPLLEEIASWGDAEIDELQRSRQDTCIYLLAELKVRNGDTQAALDLAKRVQNSTQRLVRYCGLTAVSYSGDVKPCAASLLRRIRKNPKPQFWNAYGRPDMENDRKCAPGYHP